MITIQVWIYDRWASLQEFPLKWGKGELNILSQRHTLVILQNILQSWKTVTLVWMQAQGEGSGVWGCDSVTKGAMLKMTLCTYDAEPREQRECTSLKHGKEKDSLQWVMHTCMLQNDWFGGGNERMKESKAKQVGGKALNPWIEFYFTQEKMSSRKDSK